MLYHITTRACWEKQRGAAYKPPGFESEGFVHACEQHQVDGVLQRYFAGQEDLLMLELNELKFKDVLKYEPGPTGELFPHIYAPIRPEWVMDVKMLLKKTAATG